MKKNLLVLFSAAVIGLINVSGAPIMACAKGTVQKVHQPEELVGKIEKVGTDFFIKTSEENLKLPKSIVKLDDFVDKTVNVSAEGIDKGTATHELKKIVNIKLAENK